MPLLAFLIAFFISAPMLAIASKRPKKVYLLIAVIVGAGSISIYTLTKVPNLLYQEVTNYYNLIIGKELKDYYDYTKFGDESKVATWEKTNRVYIWKSSLEIIEAHPWFGVGTGDEKKELYKEYKAKGFNQLIKSRMNTHNQFLSYLVRYGLVGTSIILLTFILLFKDALGNKHSTYTFFLCFMVLCMLTENIMVRQWGVVFFAFFNSCFYYGSKKEL
ncbi:hypothetical protein MTsPCn9_15200 [Croceitalea sp. MTPC9]|uniref:O-antigen ligase family protein n=1 Tax=unclassified Croceitalea TaxID=2632280 RepID=UPI002B3D16AE|nr:hypothetical protein MTsPCn6_13930 [Croceitalea sp. MTPC6]GMN16584.1 hypothetical protein MTsPCn9_15200 [Croceitalea sp. MTPC9]